MGADSDRDQRPPATMPSMSMSGSRPPGLHQDMETLGRLFKQLRTQITDSTKNASSLELLSQMEQATFASKSQVPGKVMHLPTTQQAEETNNYHQMMVNLLRQELDLEEQLVNNDNKSAADTLAKMQQTEKDGHSEFRPKRGG
jgi:hypothetical protein